MLAEVRAGMWASNNFFPPLTLTYKAFLSCYAIAPIPDSVEETLFGPYANTPTECAFLYFAGVVVLVEERVFLSAMCASKCG
jgi:hypothetical protein